MTPGTVIADRFQIERVAGRGGMGTVYRALDRATGRAVALKVLNGKEEEHGARFLREAAVLANLRHPGIVGFIADGATPEGEPYLVMDWLDGETLSARLKRGPLSVAETVALGRRVAEALGFAHGHGVIHRDLKPGNLFLPGRDIARPLVLDFGIARVTRPGQTITRTGVALGTPGYMAPEQARGQRRIDGRADLFSLGCVLFRCLAGAPPFTGDPLSAMLKAVMDPAPRVSSRRPDIPPALEDLIQALLAKSPAERPGDAGAVEAALGAIAGGAPPAAHTGSTTWPVTYAPWSGTGNLLPTITAPTSVPAASVPVTSVPVASAPAAIPTRLFLVGGAAVVLIAAAVGAGFALVVSEAPTFPGDAGKGSSLPCFAARCQDISYRDPARVEPQEIWDRAAAAAKAVDSTATFARLTMTPTVDGTVSLLPPRKGATASMLAFSFATRGGSLDVLATVERLTVVVNSATHRPVPWPACKPRDAIRAAVGSGVPRGAVGTLVYSSALFGSGAEWTYSTPGGGKNSYRTIDGSSCEVKSRASQ